jgi:hypothetical protein
MAIDAPLLDTLTSPAVTRLPEGKAVGAGCAHTGRHIRHASETGTLCPSRFENTTLKQWALMVASSFFIAAASPADP